MDMFSNWQDDLYKEMRYISRPSRRLGFPANGVKRKNAVADCILIAPFPSPISRYTQHTWRQVEKAGESENHTKFHPRGALKKRGLQNFAYAPTVVMVRQYCWSTNPFPAKLRLIPRPTGNQPTNNSLTHYWPVLIDAKESEHQEGLEHLEVYFTSFPVCWFFLLWLLGVVCGGVNSGSLFQQSAGPGDGEP